MRAALAGKNHIPRDVAEEFVNATRDPSALPERKPKRKKKKSSLQSALARRMR